MHWRDLFRTHAVSVKSRMLYVVFFVYANEALCFMFNENIVLVC